VTAAGYDMTRPAEIRTVLAVADQATGTSVMLDLYDEMRAQPVPATLEPLWAELGVAERDGKVIYDDRAPLAAIRQALTRHIGR